MQKHPRIGVLTGGGDSSGINAFLRALVVGAAKLGGEVVGIRNGWAGVVDLDVVPLTVDAVDSVTMQPGTMIGTSRTNVVKLGKVDQALENIQREKITHLVVAGGDDTLGAAAHLAKVSDIPFIGVPQTIDNDIYGTELCLGFATAIQRGVEALTSMVPSNRGHSKPMFAEVMGRDTGWLALHVAVGAEADFIAIPENDWTMDDLVRLHRSSKHAILAVFSEGVEYAGFDVGAQKVDAFGNPALEGVVHTIADHFTKESGTDPRVQVLGYMLRGGAPVSQDLNLAWSFATAALEAVQKGESGKMLAWREGRVQHVPLSDVPGRKSPVPADLVRNLTNLI